MHPTYSADRASDQPSVDRQPTDNGAFRVRLNVTRVLIDDEDGRPPAWFDYDICRIVAKALPQGTTAKALRALGLLP